MTDPELFGLLTRRQRQAAAALISGTISTDEDIAAAIGSTYHGVRKTMQCLRDIIGADDKTMLAVRIMQRSELVELLGTYAAQRSPAYVRRDDAVGRSGK